MFFFASFFVAQGDKEVVIAAVLRWAPALRFASQGLRGDDEARRFFVHRWRVWKKVHPFSMVVSGSTYIPVIYCLLGGYMLPTTF